MRRPKRLLLVLILCVAWLRTSAAIAADQPRRRLTVVSASVAGTTVTIRGLNFGERPPVVRVNEAPLALQSVSETLIVGTLAAPLAPGTYLLTVVRARRGDGDDDDAARFGVFNMAIGGAGAQGPAGPQGAEGVPGPTGPQGAPGVVDYSHAIANQTTPQAGANFNIDGDGTVGGSLAAGALTPNYDSGWFQVTSNPPTTPARNASGDIELADNLGSIPTRLTLLQCGAMSGGTCTTRVVIAGTTGYHDSGSDINPLTITADDNHIFIGMFQGWWAWGYWTAVNGWQCGPTCNTAWYRVLAWR